MPSVAMAATQSAGEKKKMKKESPEVEADSAERMKQDKKFKRKVKLEIEPDVGYSDIAVAKKRKEKKRKAVEVERDDGETSSESGEPVNDVGKKKNKMNPKEDNDEIEEKEADPNAIVNFRISKPLRDVLKDKGIESLFPIQAKTFNVILDGADLVGRARTGQGKTLAFVLPILESLTNGPAKASRKTLYGKGDKKAHPSVLVLLPTRELATQVCSDFEVYGGALGLKSCCLYGGQPMSPQIYALRNGVDIVVGTPGRVKDHLERGNIDFGSLCFRVLDEADEMMRMGFVEDVELILGMNATGKVAESETKTVQTLLFSATLPSWIEKLSAKFLKSDKKVVDLVGKEKMKASNSVTHYVLPCSASARTQVIPDIIRCYSSGGRTIIFTETKESASTLSGVLPGARALHGDIQQATREVTLSGFRSGKFQTLVATNVAARGLDIDDVQLIIQCEPPRDVEAYIHRSGRTGRAGKSGVAVMLYDPRKSNFTRIERESGVKFIQISAPQPADIAKTLGAQAAEKINEMSDSIIPVFRAAAEELLSSSDLSATDMLAKALAKAAGYTEIKTRSLLTSMENFVTVLLVCGRPIYLPSFAYQVLRRFLPEEKVESIKGLALTADGQGAVFDVAAEDLDTFLAGQQNAAGVQLEVVKTLPQLQGREPLSRGGRFGGGRGGGGGGRGGGGYRRDGGGRFSGGRGGGRGNNRRW